MAPKGKKGKKGGDEWDEGLGEVADPIAQAEQEAKAAEAEEEDDGGGLMAALKKNKEKRKKKGKTVENNFVEGEDANGAETPVEPAVDLSSKAPVEATMEDDVEFALPVKGKKGGKQPPPKKAAEPTPVDNGDGDDEDAGGRVKTKSEKDKEKKEREKQRKKDNAAAKKKAEPPQKAEPKVVEKAAMLEAPAPEATGGKKKKLNPALAAIQKAQEERKQREEEEARAAEEAKQKEAEEQKRIEEEDQKEKEARAAKKAKEKAKIEQMKREGTYKTEKQRKDEAQQKLRLQQMLESGAKVAGIEGSESEANKTTRDDRKKKNPRKEAEERRAAQAKEEEEARRKLEELKLREEQEKKAAEEAERARIEAEEKQKEDEPSEDEDWEALAAKEENSGVPAAWDADSDDEMDGPVSREVNGKAVQNDSAGTKRDIKEANGKATQESEDEEEDESSDEEEKQRQSVAAKQAALKRQQAADKRKAEVEAARNAASSENLRSPICCILGHVDTGKTKLLDKVRQTNVQEGEAGGITQQIGATYFPVEALEKKTAVVNKDGAFEFKVPGLLVIDTPGHESFTNLRSRGSSLCNIAILVVDIMHGLEPQTLESMRLLRDRKTPFIVALNKIDRLYNWKPITNNGFRDSLAMQAKGVQNEFRDRLEKTKLAFSEQGFNAELFYENKSMAKYVSLVPTSAHTGEGIPDMLKLLVTLTQERMTRQLMYLSEVECTVLEVKVIEGLGTTIDVVLSNGILNEGDTIVLCGTEGAITTDIRALLTPAEMKELRVKSQYVHNKTVKAALGVKIAANGLDHAIAGSRLLVAKNPDDEDELEELEEDVMGDLENLMSKISPTKRGVTVQASTLGSLEALLEFLRTSKIPVSNISIGPVHKRDVITASAMLEKAKEYAVMLCFDVKVDKEAMELAENMGVKIFTAEIIYHLFDDFTKHMKALNEAKKEESRSLAVFPCVCKPVAVFNKKDPIVVGVDVVEGNLRMGTPMAVVKHNPVTGVKDIISLGRVTSIERDHKAIPICKRGQPSVAVKIEGANQPMYGRQLEEKDTLYSHISRASIDTLKEFYRDEVDKEEWGLIAKTLKGLFDVQ